MSIHISLIPETRRFRNCFRRPWQTLARQFDADRWSISICWWSGDPLFSFLDSPGCQVAPLCSFLCLPPYFLQRRINWIITSSSFFFLFENLFYKYLLKKKTHLMKPILRPTNRISGQFSLLFVIPPGTKLADTNRPYKVRLTSTRTKFLILFLLNTAIMDY